MTGPLTPRRVEVGFWLGLCAAMAAGIGYQTDWGRRWYWQLPESGTVANDFAQPSLAEPFQLPSPDTFLETTLRPIFVVTRRPAPIPPPPEPPKPSMKKDQFVLTGTTLVPEGKFAFLLEKAANKVRVVAEGKEINGIRVKEVSAARVVLSQHDDQEVLILQTAKHPIRPAPPANQPATVPRVPQAPTPADRPQGPQGPLPAEATPN